MSIQRRRAVTALAALLTFAAPLAARAEPVRNVVLVHGAWVDGSGWRAVHDILVSKGFHVTEVQEPETSFRGRRGRDPAHSRPAGRSDASRRPQLRRVGRHRGRRSFEGRRTGLCRGARARCRRGRSHARQTYPERPRQDSGSHRQDAGRLHLPHALRLPDAVRARPVPPAGRVRGEFAGAGRRRGLHHAADAPLRGGPSRAGESSPAATRSSIRSSNASTTSGPAAI